MRFVSLFISLPKIRQLGFRLKPNLDFANNAHFKTLCELLFPAILSSTVGQIHIYVDMFFASSLKEGAWTAIGLRTGFFSFLWGFWRPRFWFRCSRFFLNWSQKKIWMELEVTLTKALGCVFASFPDYHNDWVLGYDGIKLIFQRGAFDDKAKFMVTQALWYLAFSMIPYVFRDSITRVFYSFNDSRIPFFGRFKLDCIKVFPQLAFGRKTCIGSGIGGITLSTSLVTLFNACILGLLIKNKIKLDYKSLFKNFAKMVLAGLVTLGLSWALGLWFNNFSNFDAC